MYATRKTGLVWCAMLAAGLILALTLGCDEDDDRGANYQPPGEPGPDSVWMLGFAFVPETLVVSSGTTVTWVNKDGALHTVTAGTPGSPSGDFDSGDLTQDMAFTHAFAQPGTFPYFCTYHSDSMQGVVVVN